MYREGAKTWILQSAVVLLLWLVTTWQGWFSAAQIWWENEIFNHGFFIVPGFFYLVYLKREKLKNIPVIPTTLPIIFVAPLIFIYVAGVAGDVKLLQHFATFSLLPVLVWMMVGHQFARAILFPLVFVLFSIPAGEQLIPVLQTVTAHGASVLLRLSGVPLYQTGLYLEIPQGRFLVAEACSGVSFFIASLVIGSLYAYLNLFTISRRLSFFALSIVFPIVANIIRVFGIIIIAYYSDMEYAAGADHIIYGWFFFAFVVLCLLGLGEFFREKFQPNSPFDADLQSTKVVRASTRVVMVAGFALLVGIAWLQFVSQQESDDSLKTPQYWLQLDSDSSCPISNWTAIAQVPDEKQLVNVANKNCQLQVFQAWFSEQGNELINGNNRLFDPKGWSREGTGSVEIEGYSLNWYAITSPEDEKRKLIAWYIVNGHIFTDKNIAKLYQVSLAMMGMPSSGLQVVVSLKGSVKELATEIKAHDWLATQ